MANVKEIQSADFQSQVLQASQPVLVDFHATWCGPCKMIAPILDGLAGEFGDKIRFVKVDIDQAPDLAAQYHITGVPTLMFFRNGTMVDQIVGAPSARALRTRIESVVGAGAGDTGAKV